MRQSSSSASSCRSAGDGEAEAGGWLLRAAPKHACILPKIDARTFVGSVWQCGECGQHWLLKECTVHRGPVTAETVKRFVRITARRYQDLAQREQRSAS